MGLPGLKTTDGNDLNTVYYDYIIPIIQRYNEDNVSDFRALLSYDEDEKVKNYYLPEAGRMQKLEQDYGMPDYRTFNKGKFQHDTAKYGDAFRYTETFLKDASTLDIIRFTQELLIRDKETIKFELLKALIASGTSANSLYNGVYGTYEGISAPPTYGANTFAAGHNHYVGNNYASGTIQLTDITLAKKHIAEHGTTGQFVGFINSTQTQEIANLATFVYSSDVNKIANPISDKIAVDGFVGRLLGVDFIETEEIPSGYVLIGKFTENDLGKILAFVQPNDASWRGLQLIPAAARPDYPLVGASARRFFSVAVKNRGSAYCFSCVSGSSVYTSPAYFS